jgi:hypothetical protein
MQPPQRHTHHPRQRRPPNAARNHRPRSTRRTTRRPPATPTNQLRRQTPLRTTTHHRHPRIRLGRPRRHRRTPIPRIHPDSRHRPWLRQPRSRPSARYRNKPPARARASHHRRSPRRTNPQPATHRSTRKLTGWCISAYGQYSRPLADADCDRSRAGVLGGVTAAAAVLSCGVQVFLDAGSR